MSARNTRISAKRHILLVVIGLLGLFAATQWNTLSGPFERDEGEYAYSAWLMREGLSPYQHAFMQKPPMIIYTYAVSQLLTDQATWPPRLLGALFVAVTAALVGMIAAKAYGPRCGWISVALLLPLFTMRNLIPFAANTEKFMNVPMMAVVALYVFYRQRAARRIWFGAGFLAMLALMYKPICLFVLLFICVLWAVETLRLGAGKSAPIAFLAYSFLGAFVAADLVLAYFLHHGSMDALWESAILYNVFYSNISTWNPASFLRIMGSVAAQWWVLWALLVWFIVKRPGRWWFYLILLALAMVSAYKDPNGHYYLMTLPFWAIVAGAALSSAMDGLSTRLAGRISSPHATATIVAVGLLCLPVAHQFAMSSAALYRWCYSPENPFAESALVAERVAALTRPDDPVFVAGSEPQLLYYAKRKSPTRFVIMYPLMLPTPFARAYHQEAIAALKARPPEVIVLCNSNFSWLRFTHSPQMVIEYLAQLLATGQYGAVGGYNWHQGKGRWVAPYDPQAGGAYSMVVFKRLSDRPTPPPS